MSRQRVGVALDKVGWKSYPWNMVSIGLSCGTKVELNSREGSALEIHPILRNLCIPNSPYN